LALILGGLVVGLYTNAPRIDLLLAAVVFAAIVFVASTKPRMRVVELSVLLLLAFEFLSLALSQYRANSIRSTWAIAIAVLLYCAVRYTISTPVQIASLGTVLALGGAWLGVSALGQFNNEAVVLTGAGFSSLVAFRSQLIAPPAPWIAGEWFTVVLLAVPFTCAVPVYFWRREKTWAAVIAALPSLVVTAALALSMSRAVFWSTVVFYFSVCALLVFSRTVTLRSGSTLLAGTLGSLVLILACESAIYPGLIKAYAGHHTSQTRSSQGRVEIWNRSLQLVRKHPLMGVGSANSALMLLSSADEEETTGFASRTFSLPVQILVEKGIIGLVLYALFLALIAREFVQTMRCSPPIHDPDESGSEPNHLPAKPSRRTIRPTKRWFVVLRRG
jgi:O-antigen ligase